MPASRTKLLAVALSVGISAVGLTTGAADGAPAQPHRHTSGLLVLPSFEHGVIPPGLADEYDTYELLAEANPEDFGYVHEESGQLILDVASESGRGKAKALGSGRALPDPAHDPFGRSGLHWTPRP